MKRIIEGKLYKHNLYQEELIVKADNSTPIAATSFSGTIMRISPKLVDEEGERGEKFHNWRIEEFDEYEEADSQEIELNEKTNNLLLGGYFNMKENKSYSLTTVYDFTIYLESKQMLVWNKIEANSKERIVIGEFKGRFICLPTLKQNTLVMYDNAKPVPDKPRLTLEQVKGKLGFDFELIK